MHAVDVQQAAAVERLASCVVVLFNVSSSEKCVCVCVCVCVGLCASALCTLNCSLTTHCLCTRVTDSIYALFIVRIPSDTPACPSKIPPPAVFVAIYSFT